MMTRPSGAGRSIQWRLVSVGLQLSLVQLDIECRVGGGMTRAGVDDCYAIGPPDVVLPAVMRFERDLREWCELRLQRGKTLPPVGWDEGGWAIQERVHVLRDSTWFLYVRQVQAAGEGQGYHEGCQEDSAGSVRGQAGSVECPPPVNISQV